MPTYEYECDACHDRFERWQSFNDAKLIECPACHEPKLRRLFGSGAAIVFKGSGFYETDYRRSDAEKKARASDDKPAEVKEAKTETPAAKADASASPPPAAKSDAPKAAS